IRNRSFFIVLTLISRVSLIVWTFIFSQILIDIYLTCIDGIFFFSSIIFFIIICSELVIIMIITFFQSWIFLEFLFDALFKSYCRQLNQLHQLNLLRGKFLL